MIVKITEDILYYHAAKCGSRTILGWNALLVKPNLLHDHPEFFKESNKKEYGQIRTFMVKHDLSQPYWRSPEKVPKLEAKIRFCIIRDPVERFISGYTNRVLYHKNLDNKETISLDEFIEKYHTIVNTNMIIDVHFKPQCHFYGLKPEIFTHIFNMNQMDEIKNLIEQETGKQLPMLKLQQSGDYAKPKITQEQEKWIKDLYKQDYDVYSQWM